HDRLTKSAQPLQLPVGSGELFTGHLDVIERKQYIFDEATLGKTFTVTDVPEVYREAVEEARHKLIDTVVEHDEQMMEKYLAGEELTNDEIRHAIRVATCAGKFVPILCGASFKNKGVQALLDAVVDFMPAPIDVPAIK